jgi:hypothetical protein
MAVNAEDHAIVVGINTYPWLRILRAALTDAARFAEWLVQPDGGGLPQENVKTIFGPDALPANPFEIRPIQEEIDDHLSQIGVELNERIGRRLYFYFAGHGIGPSFDDVGMLMAHAAPRRLKRNIGLARYRDYFHEHAVFDEVVFILDCCRDRARGVETAGPDFVNAGTGPVGQVRDLTIMAAAYGEKAFEPVSGDSAAAEPRGLLTAAVLEGLRSPDAADGLGRITSRSLEDYIRQRVPQLAGDARVRQEPEVSLPQSEIIFGTLATETMTVRILARSGFAGDIVLFDDDWVELDRRPAADVTKAKPPWQVMLNRNRWYGVQCTDPPGRPPDILDPKQLKGPGNVFTVKPARAVR